MDIDFHHSPSQIVVEPDVEYISLPNLQIKDEPEDDVEVTNIMDHSNYTLPVSDPMNLLEPSKQIDRDIYIRGGKKKSSETDSVGSKESRRFHTEETWQKWMEQYPWLLHEEEDVNYCFCLYCNVKLKIRKEAKIAQHSMSLNHNERENNYLAFRCSEEEANQCDPMEDIKQEFGTDSIVAAMKFKRISQVEALNNFNWRRWLESYKWIERVQQEGTIGFCIYCKVRFNVEFSYLRERHEESKTHRESERIYMMREMNNTQTKNEKNLNLGMNINPEPSEGNELVTMLNTEENSLLYTQFYEETSPSTCRCNLCNVAMVKGSFRKHMKSQIHQSLIRSKFKKKDLSMNMKMEIDDHNRRFENFERSHPWLVSDPVDATYGYCKYCKKRFMYAFSKTKRHQHENSLKHLMALRESMRHSETDIKTQIKSQIKLQNGGNLLNTLDPKKRGNLSDASDENEHIVKKFKQNVETKFSNIPWCIPNINDPLYVYCIYCEVQLYQATFSREKHELSFRHRVCEEVYKRQSQLHTIPNNELDQKNIPRIQESSWIHSNISKTHCKICNIHFSRPENLKRHENSRHHKKCMRYYYMKDSKPSIEIPRVPEEIQATSTPPVAEISPILSALLLRQRSESQVPGHSSTLIADSTTIQNDVTATDASVVQNLPIEKDMQVQKWQDKFQWLQFQPNEIRPNYVYCTYCEVCVYASTEKLAVKHQKTSNHIRARLAVSRNTENYNELFNGSGSEITDMVLLELQNRFTWIELNRTNDKCNIYCKYCNIRLVKKLKYIHGHDKSNRHCLAKQNYYAGNESNNKDISMRNQNIRSNDLTTIGNHSQLSFQEEKRIAERLTSAHAEILKLTRQTMNTSSVLSSPFTLAACLAPFVPRPPKRKLNVSQSMSSPVGQSSHFRCSEGNIYDLFFESISQTVKQLPADLAAEGKMKVMQVICDLELRALKRKKNDSQISTIDITTDEPNGVQRESPDNGLLIPATIPNGHVTSEEMNLLEKSPDVEVVVISSPPIAVNKNISTLLAKDFQERGIYETPTKESTVSPGIRCIPLRALKTPIPETLRVAQIDITSPISNGNINDKDNVIGCQLDESNGAEGNGYNNNNVFELNGLESIDVDIQMPCKTSNPFNYISNDIENMTP